MRRVRGSIAGWALAAALGALALDVVLGPVQTIAVLLVGLAPWLMLAALPLAVGAAIARRWLLTAAGAALVAFHAIVLLPGVAPWGSLPRAAAGTAFTVFDANVRWDNVDLRGIGAQIAAARPDLVLVQELSRANVGSLERSGAVRGYRYRGVWADAYQRGYGVWSRLPLRSVGLWRAADAEMVQATLAAPGGDVTLLVVHTYAPTANQADDWRRELAAIAARARTSPRPLLVIGDFNATVAMRQMRSVLDAGLTDAASAAGEGWRMTWPHESRVPLPVMRLDHALFSPQLTIRDYRLGDPAGSDHAPMLFTVARARVPGARARVPRA